MCLGKITLTNRSAMALGISEKLPCRIIVALMLFLSVCLNYTTRVNLSVNLIAMVPVANRTYSSSQYTMEWTTFERAKVLSSYFWGYLAGATVSLLVTDLLKPRLTLIVIALVNSILTMLSPVAAKESYVYLIVIRVVMGLFSGSLFPITYVIISKWAVEIEKNRFVSIPVGGTIGTFFAWIICGFVIDKFGWEWGFYVFGIASLFTTALLFLCVYDTPEQHPRITNSELIYLKDGRKCESKTKKKMVPYFYILTSIPCWSCFLMDFGTGWGIYFVITAAPHYLSTALGYSTSSTSYLSALIYFVRCFSAFGFAYVGDFILRKNLMSLNMLRNCACFFAFLLPGCAIFCMSIQGYSSSFYVFFIVLSMGCNGAVVVSTVANKYDLTKNFIGTLSSVGLIAATVAGNVTPFVTAYFVQDDETNPELWRPVFYVGATVYILTGLQFIIFGSTNIQHWDLISQQGKQEGSKRSVDYNISPSIAISTVVT